MFSGSVFFQDLDAHSKLEDGAIDLTLRLEVKYCSWTKSKHVLKSPNVHRFAQENYGKGGTEISRPILTMILK